MKGPNKLECYITLGWKGLPGTIALANDTEHNDIQHNDTQHNGLVWDTRHKRRSA
jgi:hypothetical protein